MDLVLVCKHVKKYTEIVLCCIYCVYSVVVDFFGMFFTLSWVFYHNDNLLNGDFLGYFTFIGEVWLYKVLISVVPFICGLILFWYLFYMLHIIYETADGAWCYNICVSIGILICATMAVGVFCGVCFIMLEVCCFTLVAVFVYMIFTTRWWKFDSDHMSQMIKQFIEFIAESNKEYGPNDRVLRILAINHAMHSIHNGLAEEIYEYIEKVEVKDGVKGLNKITYYDIRNHSKNSDRAKITPDIVNGLKKSLKELPGMVCGPNKSCWKRYEGLIGCIAFFIGVFMCFPIFVVAKLFQMFFPYFIIISIYWKNDWDHNVWSKCDTFQIVMLSTYIGLQIVLIILGIYAIRYVVIR